MASSTNSKKVVILGCGPLGAKAASELDKDFDVTVIERQEKVQHVLASPRAFAQEGFESKIFISYDNLLKNGRVIRDEAVEILQHSVVLKSGSVVNFDYLIIATGSNYLSPVKGKDSKETENTFRKYQEALKTAKSVLIVGGGNIGVEIAGEIKYFHPKIQVTIVNSGAKLMHAAPANDTFRDVVETKIKALGVEIIPNTKIVLTDEDREAILTSIERRTLKTTDGKELVSDVQILATGLVGFNSSPLRANFSEDIDPATGKVKVNQYFQLESKPHIFAGGDVALTGQYEQAYLAAQQAIIIAGNIRALAKAGNNKPALKAAKKPSHYIISVVVGPKNGQVLGFPFKSTMLGKSFASMKSTDFFLSNTKKVYGVVEKK